MPHQFLAHATAQQQGPFRFGYQRMTKASTNNLTTPPIPAYKAIANDLRNAIIQNRYPLGHRLPTEEELAETYGLGRQTIRRVFQELASEGLVYRVRRRGTFAYPVTSPLTSNFGHVADVVDLSTDDETEILEPLHDAADDADVRELLQLGDAQASALTIRRVKHGLPLYYAELRFPPAISTYLSQEPALSIKGHRGRFTVIGLIDLRWPESIVNLTQTLFAVAATKQVATHLECEPRTPVMKVERIYYDRFGVPVELATTYYHPTNFVMQMRLRR